MTTHCPHLTAPHAPGGTVISARGPGARGRVGMTLLELVVVLAILALLVAVTVPLVLSAHDSAKRTTCAANLRQIGVAVAVYSVQNDMALPVHYHGGGATFDTFAMRTGSGELVNLGLLADEVTDSDVLYCPTQDESRSPAIAFDSAANRWAAADAGIRTINSSYAARARGFQVDSLPRWTMANYTNKVVYSDFTGVDKWQSNTGRLRGMIRAPHKSKGYNRLFGEGSVVWLGARAVEEHRPVVLAAPTDKELNEYYRLFDVLP